MTQPKLFEDFVKTVINTEFHNVIKQPGLSTSEVIFKLEGDVTDKLLEVYPGQDIETDVIARVGVETTYVVRVDNHTTRKSTSVELKEPGIDPAPITKSMGKRSNLAIDITIAVRDTLSETYLNTEPFTDTAAASDAIYEAVLAKLNTLSLPQPCDIEVCVDINATAAVIVDVPGVTKVRLRATRKPELLPLV